MAHLTNAIGLARSSYIHFGMKGLVAAVAAKGFGKSIELEMHPPAIPHPVLLRVATTDPSVYDDIFTNEQYACDARRPAVIVDAGAYIGLASVYFANKFPSARIFAIEPEPRNFSVLLKNIAPYPGIRAINAALWKSDGMLAIESPHNGAWAFQVREKRDAANMVKAICLETLMQSENIEQIDILKVDIEGAEQEVFQDSPAWIRKTELVMMELMNVFAPVLRLRFAPPWPLACPGRAEK